jgi:ribosome modulation factor
MKNPFGHSVGVSIVVPYVHNFVPTPNLKPLEIAYHKGRDAARRGHREDVCPYDPGEHPHLNEHWMRGYNDAVPKADTSQRLKGGAESGYDLDPSGGEEPVSE